jgi:hypothetical protein
MKLLITSLILFTSTAFSYEGFHCVPSMRETRMQVLVQNDEVQVLVVNPAGYEFMPQFDGPHSIFNISFNKMQGEDLKDLGDSFVFAWPKSACQIDSDKFTVSCRSEAKAAVKGIKSFGLTTTEVTEKYESETYEKRKFRLSLEQGNVYFVALQFDTKFCSKFN